MWIMLLKWKYEYSIIIIFRAVVMITNAITFLSD